MNHNYDSTPDDRLYIYVMKEGTTYAARHPTIGFIARSDTPKATLQAAANEIYSRRGGSTVYVIDAKTAAIAESE